jgi:hypothetical protein
MNSHSKCTAGDDKEIWVVGDRLRQTFHLLSSNSKYNTTSLEGLQYCHTNTLLSTPEEERPRV